MQNIITDISVKNLLNIITFSLFCYNDYTYIFALEHLIILIKVLIIKLCLTCNGFFIFSSQLYAIICEYICEYIFYYYI